VVGAALKADSVPRRAILKARATDVIALSRPVFDEIREVRYCADRSLPGICPTMT
jgi:hypothetical protein